MNLKSVVVWGNCQAEPIVELLTGPLATHGLRVEQVPPVFLIDEAGLQRAYELVAEAAILISQPITDDYRLPGCGVTQLAAALSATGRLVTFPVVFHTGPFPYQVNAHGGDGARVAAPLTDYHDLRAIIAAERRYTLAQALSWWPAPSESSVRAISGQSIAELQRREATLDISVSSFLDDPAAMMTISHPSNGLLARIASALLDCLGLSADLPVPSREFLGAKRAPREAAVLAALDWPAEAQSPNWIISGAECPPEVVIGSHLEFYRARPDVVADSIKRYRNRLDLLGLS